MGSRALMVGSRNFGGLKNCKYLSTTCSLRKDKNLADVSKALQVVEPSKKNPEEFFYRKEIIEREKALAGYITIESELNAAGIVSGVPEEHIKTRTVRIYKPPKNAMQSGTDNINFWQIEFDTRERWENPLMGWNSSGDPMQALRVQFAQLSDAEEHCRKMGWSYFIQEANIDDPKSRSYGQNFSWNKRTRVTTK